ncbi:MAG: FAD-binding protein [Actinobacteria bacterium]|nr:FAD-binding protein [Actinomycetota bacterium]
MASDETYDLVVVGCGAAGLSTAVSFAETAKAEGHEARIAVLERSTEEERGASTRWTTAGMRVDRDFVMDPGWVGQMQEDSQGLADLEYCLAYEREVPATGKFLQEHGVEFIFRDRPISSSRLTMSASPNGGGLAIIDALAGHLAQHPGAQIIYETEAVSLVLSDEGRVEGVRVRDRDGLMRTLRAPSVMLACGGFEGNYEMLTHYLGKNAVDLKKLVPGTRFNTGDGIRMAQAIGAATSGQFDRAHTEAIDVRTDRPDAVISAHNFCIVVDADGKRFYDEGAKDLLDSFELVAFDIWEKANNTAFYITDDAVLSHELLSSRFDTDVPPAKADTIRDLAAQLGLDADALEQTVNEFNAACNDADWDPSRYDGKSTTGITPPKSNWANPINHPPYYGIPVAAAICFTYGGLKTDTLSRVVSTGGFPIPGLYAAGEISGITYHSYPALTTVLRACTFGRIAGAHAAVQMQEAVTVR